MGEKSEGTQVEWFAHYLARNRPRAVNLAR
jgi:hypothetical protein